MNLKQIHQEYILNHPATLKTGKSRSQLTFRLISGIRESAFSISQLFTIADSEEIIRQRFCSLARYDSRGAGIADEEIG